MQKLPGVRKTGVPCQPVGLSGSSFLAFPLDGGSRKNELLAWLPVFLSIFGLGRVGINIALSVERWIRRLNGGSKSESKQEAREGAV